MAAKKNVSITLRQLAKELAALAADLEQGKMRIGSSLVDITAPNFFKTKQKVKDDKAYFTLSFQAPLADAPIEQHTASAEKKNAPPLDTKPPKKTGSSLHAKQEGRAPGGKKIKKEITRQWKNIARGFASQTAPTAAEAKALLKACEDYNLYTESHWSEDWHACVLVVKESLNAAISGDFAKAESLGEEVNRLTKECHRKYK